uniref:Uncharacterized protein n=1 Tax=Bracon brevicornis TaxID=1563983 RepID=A0A6V7KBW9_9HYME
MYWVGGVGMASGCVGDARRCVAAVADYPVSAAGCMVLCPFFTAFSCLAALPFLVWPLFAALAGSSDIAAGSKRQSGGYARADLRHFAVAGEHGIGQSAAVNDNGGLANLYVAPASC